jgi:hypothetical protein
MAARTVATLIMSGAFFSSRVLYKSINEEEAGGRSDFGALEVDGNSPVAAGTNGLILSSTNSFHAAPPHFNSI